MDDRPVPWYVLPGPAPATRFTGVTREEGQSYGGLYEVRTTDGVWVRLHDMSFMDMTFEPASPPSLRLRFVYDDPQYTPEGAVATPMAVFTFGNAVVLGQEDERPEPGTPADWLRQVEEFSYDETTACFGLYTFTTSLVFTASTCTLTLEPLPT